MAGDVYEYIITVETGLKRGAGTTSKVWFTLYGSHGDTGMRALEGSDTQVCTPVPRLSGEYYLRSGGVVFLGGCL